MTTSDLERLKAAGKIVDYKISAGKVVEGVTGSKKPNKYRNKRFVDDEGNKWDSKTEFVRWIELKQWEKMGIISGLKRQVEFQLSVCKYIADFVYLNNEGKEIIEDVKSVATRKLSVFAIKKKLMKKELNITIKIT